MEHDAELDVRGFRCPLPVLKARKRLEGLEVGATLKVLATDPVAAIDFPHFCAEAGHELLETRTEGEFLTFLIRKVSAR